MMSFLESPAQMNSKELELEYEAIKGEELKNLLEDENISQDIKSYFRQHALNVELEYILRKASTSYE